MQIMRIVKRNQDDNNDDSNNHDNGRSGNHENITTDSPGAEEPPGLAGRSADCMFLRYRVQPKAERATKAKPAPGPRQNAK